MERVESRKTVGTAAEREILITLDQILRSGKVRGLIQPVVARVRDKLRQEAAALMTWEPIPLASYHVTFPEPIKSSWVFVLRAGGNTGAERHPNSHQRMMSFEGSGDMKTEKKRKNGEGRKKKGDDNIDWQSNVLISDPNAPLERRWISIRRMSGISRLFRNKESGQ